MNNFDSTSKKNFGNDLKGFIAAVTHGNAMEEDAALDAMWETIEKALANSGELLDHSIRSHKKSVISY
jgi:hypothetical protein